MTDDEFRDNLDFIIDGALHPQIINCVHALARSYAAGHVRKLTTYRRYASVQSRLQEDADLIEDGEL